MSVSACPECGDPTDDGRCCERCEWFAQQDALADMLDAAGQR